MKNQQLLTKLIVIILGVIFLYNCTNDRIEEIEQDQNVVEKIVIEEKYQFDFSQISGTSNGKTQIKKGIGKIIFLNNEIHVYMGGKAEKFFIQDIKNESSVYTFYTQNNKQEKSNFKLSESNGKTLISADLTDVLMEFGITSGNIKELFTILYNKQPQKSQKTSCDCQTMKREGVSVIQCPPTPIAQDKSKEIGVAISSNGYDIYVATSVRFHNKALKINGNLSIRLKNNEILILELVNQKLSYIGDSEIAQGVFSLTNENKEKLESSDLMTISIVLGNNISHTLECIENSSVLRDQLICVNKTLPKSDEIDITDVSSEKVIIKNQYSIEIPSFLSKTSSLNPDASLQYENTQKKFYILVIDEKITDFHKALSDYKLTDKYKSNLEGYSKITTEGFEENVIVKNKTTKEYSHNNLSIIHNNYSVNAQGANTQISFFFVKGKNTYYQIMIYYPTGLKKEYDVISKTIASSFKEVNRG